jgi:hypothetical protein
MAPSFFVSLMVPHGAAIRLAGEYPMDTAVWPGRSASRPLQPANPVLFPGAVQVRIAGNLARANGKADIPTAPAAGVFAWGSRRPARA